jgi:hypothetical protein
MSAVWVEKGMDFSSSMITSIEYKREFAANSEVRSEINEKKLNQ